MRNEKAPIVALLLATFIWGSTFALVKSALSDVDPLSFLALRFAVALGTTTVAILLTPGWSPVQGLRFAEVMMGSVTGAALFSGFLFQTLGLQYTSAANSAFITGLCVIMVPFLIWFRGRKPKRMNVIGAFLSLFGLFWLSSANLTLAGWGDMLTLVCALMFALHIICLGTFGRQIESFRFFAVQLFTSAVLAILIGVGWGGPVRWSLQVIVALVVTGILATSVAFFLQTWAQRRMAPARASIWILTEPLFALGFGVVLLGAIPPPLGLMGAAFMLLGVGVSEAGHRHLVMGRLSRAVAKDS